MVARRAMYTTARERRRNLLKVIRAKCEVGAAEAIKGKTPVPVRSAAMTVAGNREATRPGGRRASVVAEAALAVVAAAEAGVAVVVAVVAVTGKQNYPRLITTSGAQDMENIYAADEERE